MREENSPQPAFGEADLSNCERELIHLPGSIQPHGAVVVLEGEGRRVLQASRNCDALLGILAEQLVGSPLSVLGGDIPGQLLRQVTEGVSRTPTPFRGTLESSPAGFGFEALLHRNGAGALLLELEPVELATTAQVARGLPSSLADGVGRLGRAASMEELWSTAVALYREIAGYDRVMVYRFDPDGHGEVVAEAREEHLEPYLGLHYPASDIPQRARELYLRNRVRVLVDVHYQPVPLLPRLHPPTGEELDMSMSWLRSMSPLHLQYLKNMGVTATLVVSIVRGGALWGLIACHHYSPRRLPYAVRAACDLVAEVMSTRIAVMENFARMRAEARIRRLEGEVIQATNLYGDWRPALLDDPDRVLRLVGASGAVLAFDGQLHTMGQVPGSSDLRLLLGWIGEQRPVDRLVASHQLGRDLPELEGAGDTASGVLAVPLSSQGEYLVWLRGEQVQEVRWAGNPNKPVVVGDDPRDLSPRRSFAVWTESVRGTSRGWTQEDRLTAQVVAASLRDVILQVRSMSYLLTERRLAHLRDALQRADEGVLLCDGEGRILIVNEAFSRLFRHPHTHLVDLDDLPRLFRDPTRAREMIRAVREEGTNWRGELLLRDEEGGEGIPVAIRADRVERPDGLAAVGHIVLVTNLTQWSEARATRERLRRAILDAQEPLVFTGAVGRVTEGPPFVELAGEAAENGGAAVRALIKAILTNASVAVAELADGGTSPAVIPTLDGLEAATFRAADLTRRITEYARLPTSLEE